LLPRDGEQHEDHPRPNPQQEIAAHDRVAPPALEHPPGSGQGLRPQPANIGFQRHVVEPGERGLVQGLGHSDVEDECFGAIEGMGGFQQPNRHVQTEDVTGKAKAAAAVGALQSPVTHHQNDGAKL
jgi:hypothetical protein